MSTKFKEDIDEVLKTLISHSRKKFSERKDDAVVMKTRNKIIKMFKKQYNLELDLDRLFELLEEI